MSFMDLPPVEARGRGRCLPTSPPAPAPAPASPAAAPAVVMPSYSGALTGGGNRQLWKSQTAAVPGADVRAKELRRPKSVTPIETPSPVNVNQDSPVTVAPSPPVATASPPVATVSPPVAETSPPVPPTPASPPISSTLSVDAKEFVPRGRISLESLPLNEVKEFVPRSLRQPSSTAPQEPERVFPEFVPRGSVRLPEEFVPRQQQDAAPQDVEAESWDDFMPPAEYRRPAYDNGVSPKDAAVRDLVEIMDHIAVMPESFDKMVAALLDAFTCWLEDVETTVAIVDTLFERSLVDANFRFNGVRLCGLVNNQAGNMFRSHLLKRCAMEHTVALSSVASAPQRTHGYVLLIADMYVTLEVVPGSKMKIDVLARAVLEVLNTLIALPTPDNVKCVCDTLKLAGFHLSAFDKAAVDAVFMQLHKIHVDRNTPASVQLYVLKVSTLRRENWGLGASTQQPASTVVAPAFTSPGNGPVFYGPDGNELTPEESLFLQENSSATVEAEDSEAYTFRDTVWDQDVVMNAEVQAAYEQFCRLNDD